MKGSAIVNVASTPALVGDTEGLVYASAKGAVVSMTRMLAKMLAPKIRVNCMAFGSFETTWVDWLNGAQVEAYRKAIPLKRFGKPIEAARLALFQRPMYISSPSLTWSVLPSFVFSSSARYDRTSFAEVKPARPRHPRQRRTPCTRASRWH